MRYRSALMIALAATGGLRVPCGAAEPTTAPAAAPAATAGVEDVGTLIKQLGHDDPKARDDASRRLRRLGQVAVPALAEAQKSDDPEVAGRAQAVTRQIEEDARPVRSAARVGRGLILAPGARLAPAGVRAGRGAVREVNTTEGGKRIKIREDADGVSVTTVEKTNEGAEVTHTTRVKDPATLKRAYPELYPLYEKHLGGAGGAATGAAGEIRIEPLGAEGNVDVDRMIREARRVVEEHRPMIEAQRRLADEQLREARRQLDEQVRKLREQQPQK